MAEQKITPEELKSLKNIQDTQEALVLKFGELEFQIQNLELEKEKLVEQLESYKNKEKKLAGQLTEKYGKGTINIEKGIFQS
jgi:hypothetical protein